MSSVSRTELNQQTAKVLARVAAGERITITDRGKPVAELVPPARTLWDGLVADGKVTRATNPGPMELPPPIESDLTAAEIIDDIRRDLSS